MGGEQDGEAACGWACCGRGIPTGGREGNPHRSLTRGCMALSSPQASRERSLSPFCPRSGPRRAKAGRPELHVAGTRPWTSSGRDWCCGPQKGCLGVPGPGPPTLGPCHPNKDTDLPTVACVCHCARGWAPVCQPWACARCSGWALISGALGGHSFSVLAVSLSRS